MNNEHQTVSKYDIVVFGATSFVGKILIQYLSNQYGINAGLKWAIAGRSESKLTEVAKSLGAHSDSLPIVIANADSEQDLKLMCSQTKVIVSTVGPYALYGESLVKICAQTGTDYCDLTGEPQWVRKMIDRYQTDAQATGAHIIHSCGFDCLPSDMGTYFTQQQSEKLFGMPCSNIKMRIKSMKGGASGGTVASLLNVVKEASKEPSLLKELMDIYSLCPPSEKRRPKHAAIQTAKHDSDSGAWIAPFVMAGVNERVVLRSNAISNNAYGDLFTYNEALIMGRGTIGWLKAAGIATLSAVGMLFVAIAPIRWLLEQTILPSPGQGPSHKAQLNGHYDVRFFGTTEKGDKIECKVTGDLDPGYGSTARMLGEVAVSLAKDITPSEKPGGFWTTATIFDNRLIQRLKEKAEINFEMVNNNPHSK